MGNLTKEQILEWCRKYDTEEDQWSPRLETELGNKFRTKKEMTKGDLIQVVKWKFATNKHRLKRELNLVEETNERNIIELSKLAFASKDELLRLKYLMQIKGVGNAVASVVLTFYDPKNYGVFDIHMYDELFNTNPRTRPKDISSNPKLYIKLLEKLREIANRQQLDVRIVEKALFKKNYDESKG
jgi:thermostable 8-oxoguanine DNA glycosylase